MPTWESASTFAAEPSVVAGTSMGSSISTKDLIKMMERVDSDFFRDIMTNPIAERSLSAPFPEKGAPKISGRAPDTVTADDLFYTPKRTLIDEHEFRAKSEPKASLVTTDKPSTHNDLTGSW